MWLTDIGISQESLIEVSIAIAIKNTNDKIYKGYSKWILKKFFSLVIEEAGNVIDEKSNHTLQYEQKHNVVLPPEEKKIAINISAIRKIRYECACAKENKFTYAELWLGLSTLFFGAFFSALISKIPYKVNFLSIFFYSVCPVLGGIFGVAYFFL